MLIEAMRMQVHTRQRLRELQALTHPTDDERDEAWILAAHGPNSRRAGSSTQGGNIQSASGCLKRVRLPRMNRKDDADQDSVSLGADVPKSGAVVLRRARATLGPFLSREAAFPHCVNTCLNRVFG